MSPESLGVKLISLFILSSFRGLLLYVLPEGKRSRSHLDRLNEFVAIDVDALRILRASPQKRVISVCVGIDLEGIELSWASLHLKRSLLRDS